jgi:SAM-dependent methyltransferase
VFVRNSIPEFFNDKIVLDVGSGDINGNNRFLFTEGRYEGNDLVQAKNVTIVSKTSELPFDNSTFDTIISTECFEHDAEYGASFSKIINMLKPGGLFIFTCASTGRPEHGTRRTTCNDSYGTIGNIDGFVDYYKNITFEDVCSVIDVASTFNQYAAFYNKTTCDLYFWGIKHGLNIQYSIPTYNDIGVSLLSAK